MQMPTSKKGSKTPGFQPESNRAPVKLTGSLSKAFTNIFAKKICGDLFSQAGSDEGMQGMMYQSRTQATTTTKVVEEEDVAVEAASVEDTKQSISYGDESESDGEKGPMNPKQQLALTIQNWTKNPTNDEHVMQEGGVHALIALAGFDDPGLKSCVVNALYNLSKRETNRNELLNIGACAAIITVTLSPRTTWKIARLCALTLSNLSMAGKGGEYVMGKVNVHTALTILMGIRNHKLLPVCAQALYNLTCVTHYYPQLDRVMKALLTLPVMTGKDAFDAVPLQIKALVNCTRFHNMRDRLIEDGSLGVFREVVTGLQRNDASMASRSQLIFYVVTSLRCFSENKSCLQDLLSKQAVDLLQQVYRYCDEPARLLVIKTLRNLMKIVKLFPAVIYASAVDIVAGLSEDSDNVVTLQHVASCFHIFTQDNLRNDRKLAVSLTRALPKLLQSEDPVTQYYSVATAGNLFFTSINASSDNISSDLEHLVLTFAESAKNITDHAATQAVTVAFAKLSQEERFMSILHQHRKICPIMGFLLRIVDKHVSNLVIQESCCVAICRFLLRIEQDELFGFREGVSIMLYRLLDISNSGRSAAPSSRNRHDFFMSPGGTAGGGGSSVGFHMPHRSMSSSSYQITDDASSDTGADDPPDQETVNVLVACVSSIKALAEKGIYYAEMRQRKDFLTKLAHIAAQFHDHGLIPRLACATLTIYSFESETHTELSTPKVMQVLFTLADIEDFTVKELVCTILCNVSNCVEARPAMLRNGVMVRLTELSGTTNELLQELCARCLCNLTCSVDQHGLLIEKKVLDTLLLISLVRSGSNSTKQLAVRAMLNMLTSEEQLDAIISSGVMAALASLAEINNTLIQTMCARGFLMCSIWNDKSRAELCSRHKTLDSLFGLLKSGKETKMTVLVGRAVCNLLADPLSRRAVVNAGGLAVLKIIATTAFDELREATARVIMLLVGDKSIHSYLLREPVVSVLVYILQDKSAWSLNCAVGAFTSLAQQSQFRPSLIEKGCIPAIVGAVLKGRVTSVAVTEEICRILCLLSYEDAHVDTMLKGHVLVALYCLYKGKLCSTYSANLMAITLRNISGGIEKEKVCSTDVIDVDTPSASATRACEYIIEQEGFRLMGWLLHDYHSHNPYIYRSIVITLHNLCKVESLHERMIHQNFMKVVYQVILYSGMIAQLDHDHPEMTACHSGGVMDSGGESPHGTPRMKHHGATSLLVSTAAADHGHESGSTGTSSGTPRSKTSTPSSPGVRRHHHRPALLTHADRYNLATAIELISRTTSVRSSIVDGRGVIVLQALSPDITELSRFKVVSALTNLAATPECREKLVHHRANDLLIKLSEHAETEETQQQCTSALSSLSEHANVNSGVMSSLLVLSLRLEGGSAASSASASVGTGTGAGAGATGSTGTGAVSSPAGQRHTPGSTLDNVSSPGSGGTPGGLTISTDRFGAPVTNLRASIMEHLDKVPMIAGSRDDFAMRLDEHSEGFSILSPEVNSPQYSNGLMSSKHHPSVSIPIRTKTYAEEAIELSDITPETKEEEMEMLGSANTDPLLTSLMYEVKEFAIGVEMGGSAKKVKFDLPLPTVSAHESPSTATTALTESLHHLSSHTHSAALVIVGGDSQPHSKSNSHKPLVVPGMYKSSSMVMTHQNIEFAEEDPYEAKPTIKNLTPVELSMAALGKDKLLIAIPISNKKSTMPEVVIETPPPIIDTSPSKSPVAKRKSSNKKPIGGRGGGGGGGLSRSGSFQGSRGSNSPVGAGSPRSKASAKSTNNMSSLLSSAGPGHLVSASLDGGNILSNQNNKRVTPLGGALGGLHRASSLKGTSSLDQGSDSDGDSIHSQSMTNSRVGSPNRRDMLNRPGSSGNSYLGGGGGGGSFVLPAITASKSPTKLQR